MNKLLIHTSILLFCLVSCNSSNEQNKSYIQAPSSLPILDLQKEYPKKEIILQDIANVEYIPLETTDKSLVTWIREIHNDTIIATNKTGDIILFNRSGKFLNSFNRKGPSGEEYSDFPMNVHFDSESKEIYVIPGGLDVRILVYTPEGKYKRTLKMAESDYYATLLDYNSQKLFIEETRFADIENKGGNSSKDFDKIIKKNTNKTPYYTISKKDGKKSPLPITIPYYQRDGLNLLYPNGMSIFIGLDIAPISKLNNQIIIADYSLDTVYTYQADTLCPIAVRQNTITSNGHPIIATLDLITDRYLLWYTQEKNISLNKNSLGKIQAEAPDAHTYLYDKKTGECYDVTFINADETSIKRISANKIYMASPNSASYIYSNLYDLNKEGKLKGELQNVASKLDMEDNPVIMIVTFKE